MNAADSVGSQRNIDIAGATPTSCRLLATPVMIVIMENAALNAIRPFLDAGESAVGTAVDVQHFAATPVGHEVCATAEVINVEGKRVDFKVWASDGIEEDRQRNPPTNCDRSSFVQRAPCQKKELLTQRSA
jgi:predicted thioesterase